MIPNFRTLLCVIMFSIVSWAQSPAPLVQNIFHRNTVSLNGDWHYIVDSHDIGVGRHYYLNARPGTSTAVVEYDFAVSPTLQVPGDWNSQHPELLLYEGTVWYEKSFVYHPQPNRSTLLYIGAANYRAHVWINGQSLCEHEGGFTPFNCDATPLLKDGENVAIISVNDTRHTDDVPALAPDWWNYGGITRDVMLVEVPQTFITDYAVQLERGSTNHIAGWVRIAGAPASQKITVRIPELDLTQTATAGDDGIAHLAFDAPKLQLWSPENPKLYKVEIASDADRVSDEIGFRSIEVRGTEILLNGHPIFLRGIDTHEEAPNRSGRAHGDDDAQIMLGWVRDLGCNFVRLAHYPYDEHIIRMADRLGFMLWEEVPVYQTIDWSTPAVLNKAKQQLTELITRDRNRGAVIMWSVTNESRATPERNAFVRELIKTARSLDSTRLVTAATNQFTRPDPHTLVLNDPIVDDLDVWGINEYVGWYYGVPADLDTMKWSVPDNKPMIVSEFGGEAKQSMHGPIDQRWAEENQEEIYKHQITALQKIPFLRGMTPWVLKDFRSPNRQLPVLQDGYNRKGLISDSGQRKKAFYVLQQFYQGMAAQAASVGK
ncbi:MAG TPA: glycoside hydrolase family 2 TIM barrel-domain containing protein [Terriglobales bacterium]|nr:glycoside hydrolase family 2 TIM barrel-domain containing protein [Terriglobales bacterium]